MHNCAKFKQINGHLARCEHFPHEIHIRPDEIPCEKCKILTGKPSEIPLYQIHIKPYTEDLKPKKISKISRFFQALKIWVLLKFPFPGWGKWIERNKTCWGCKRRKILSCGSCGCFIPLKTAFASEACPEGKWLKVLGQNSPKCGCGK